MHGLVNKALQSYLGDTYGAPAWDAAARDAGISAGGFDLLARCDVAVTDAIVTAASAALDKPREALLEDFGTYLVSHHRLQALRRLLRFGGVDFLDFLHSLEDLPDRARMALPDFDLPAIALDEVAEDGYGLSCQSPFPGWGHVVAGLVRAMADDYGALVIIDHVGAMPGREVLAITLCETRFSAARRFDLAAPGA